MKKNILLIQSLALLTFVISSPLLGGKKSRAQRRQRQLQQKQQAQKQFTYQTKKQEPVTPEVIEEKKEDHTNRLQTVLQELQNSKLFLQQSQLNNSFDEEGTVIIENPLFNQQAEAISSNLVKSEVEIINIELPKNFVQIDLSQSVILPTTEKELSFWEKVSYNTSTANQILQKIILSLENGTFDTQYKNSFDLLEEAIATATKNKDITSLAKIAYLCQEKYPTSIRISEEVAQPASELLNNHYSQELNFSNTKLQSKREEQIKQWNMETAACMTSMLNAIDRYQQNIANIHITYNNSLDQETKRITNLRRDVSTFSCLNRDIRPATAELLTNNQLKNPSNIHSNTMAVSEKQVNSIAKTVQNIATTKELQSSPKYIEELTQKCLTNK